MCLSDRPRRGQFTEVKRDESDRNTSFLSDLVFGSSCAVGLCLGHWFVCCTELLRCHSLSFITISSKR